MYNLNAIMCTIRFYDYKLLVIYLLYETLCGFFASSGRSPSGND